MKTSGLVCSAALLAALPIMAAAGTLNLRTPAELAAAARVNGHISEMAEAVGKCAATAPPSSCACRVSSQRKQLDASLAAALRQFPAWRGNAITWQEGATGQTVVIDVGGLEQQLQAHCP